MNPNYIHDLTPKLQALCAQFQDLKEEAKRVNRFRFKFNFPLFSIDRLSRHIFVH